jgi:hypothetical protein
VHTGIRGEVGQQLFGVGGIEVVHQQAHANAPRCCIAQRAQKAEADRVPREQIGLHIDALFSAIGQSHAGTQGMVAAGEQAKARWR